VNVSKLALVIRHEKRILYESHFIVFCGLSDSTSFFHTISQTPRISAKLLNKFVCPDIL